MQVAQQQKSNFIPDRYQDDFVQIGARIEHKEDFVRVDFYLAKKFPFLSRIKWQKRIKNGEIRVIQNKNKTVQKLKTTYQLKKYDQIWYSQKEDILDIHNHPSVKLRDHLSTSESVNIEVLHDDGDICIFSKPPHMVVHPVGIYGKNNFLTHIKKMGYQDCSPVHRIDRETSGILVCARKSSTRAKISELFRENKIHKLYFAVTKGHGNVEDHFVVSSPIGVPDKSSIRLKLCADGNNALPAMTEFYLLAKKDDYHLFACIPKTGRTNQIRIHLVSIGQWIVGDKMYHPNEDVFLEFYEKGYTDWVHQNVLHPRHLLHNTGIFIPGFTEHFIISKIPQDMATYPFAAELFKDFLR